MPSRPKIPPVRVLILSEVPPEGEERGQFDAAVNCLQEEYGQGTVPFIKGHLYRALAFEILRGDTGFVGKPKCFSELWVTGCVSGKFGIIPPLRFKGERISVDIVRQILVSLIELAHDLGLCMISLGVTEQNEQILDTAGIGVLESLGFIETSTRKPNYIAGVSVHQKSINPGFSILDGPRGPLPTPNWNK